MDDENLRCFQKDGHTFHAFFSGRSLRCQCGDVALTDQPGKTTEPAPLLDRRGKQLEKPRGSETTRRLAYDPGDETGFIEEL